MIVKVDTNKNRLFLKFSGSVPKKELDKVYTDVRFAVAHLIQGFSVIDDLSEWCDLNKCASSKEKIIHQVKHGRH
jgi:hypothetical protein